MDWDIAIVFFIHEIIIFVLVLWINNVHKNGCDRHGSCNTKKSD